MQLMEIAGGQKPEIPGNFLICGSKEGCTRSVGPIAWKIKYYTESRRKGISYIQQRQKTNWIGHMLRRNCLLKHVTEGNMERT